MFAEVSEIVRGGGRRAGVFLLLGSFILALAVSLAAAQILAVFLVLAALAYAGPLTGTSRKLWIIAIGYVALLSGISWVDAGGEGLVAGIRNTWQIFMAPAVCALAGHLNARSFLILKRLFILSSLAVAALFLLQWSLLDPAVYGRFGCHSSPYAFAMLMIPPSLLVLADPGARRRGYVVWAVLVTALISANSRGPFLAWLAASSGLVVLMGRSFRWRRLLVPGILLVLMLLIFMPRDRWELGDLSRQHSIQHRLVIWSVIGPEIASRPFFGHGFDRFVADPADVAPRFARFAYLLRDETNPHNGYLMILHATGGVGALILIVTYGTMLAMLLIHRRSAADTALTATAAVTLAGILVAALADKTFFVTLVMLQAWFLVGLALSTPVAVAGTAVAVGAVPAAEGTRS